MPIYEYACSDCRTVYQFWTQRIGETKIPDCPHCGKPDRMRKLVSAFAIGKKQASSDSGKNSEPEEGPGGEPDLGGGDFDPFAKMSPEQQAYAEREMMRMMSEVDSLDENDPRQMGAFMRRLTETTGMDLGPEMREAIRRLESGEDPEKVEEEMGPLFGDMEEGPGGMGGGGWNYDDTLYDM